MKFALLLIVLFVCSCALNPPDVRVCVRLPFSEGGRCNNTVSEQPYDMSEDEYQAHEVGQVYMSPNSFGEIKKFILEACERSNDCSLENTKKRLETIEGLSGGL